MARGQLLYKKAKKIIPGGVQLLSKRPELHLPESWPSYYKKALGCEIWDLDGKKLYDMSYMGIGTCVLGYADKEVNQAVKEAIDNGNTSTLNCPEEVELAELLLEIHPWANMVRFARGGGEAMAVAVRIARAHTDKDKILFCGYHGWHDWYLASNLSNDKALDGHLLPGLNPKGVPRSLKDTSLPFEYNNTEKFLELLDKHNGKIGAVVIEPIRNWYPKKGFLETIRKETKKRGIVLIIDEVSAGFRIYPGGAHLALGITPDIAVFSKSLGNGFPVAAIIGTSKVMSAAQETFISSTNWTERVGTVAALAMIKKYKKNKVHKHLEKIGKMVQEGWLKAAKKTGIDIDAGGIYPSGHFSFQYPNHQALKTLFTQKMLDKGFLATTAFYASYAHKEKHVQLYLRAVEEVFTELKTAIDSQTVEKDLKGPISHTGFKRIA